MRTAKLSKLLSSRPWNPLGTLWKDFSSIFLLPSRTDGTEVLKSNFCKSNPSGFRQLASLRFKNLCPDPSLLWKPDCDCFAGR